MTTTEVWTIGRLLQWTTDFLKKSGADSPRLEAEVLLAHAKKCPRIQLYTSFNDEPTEAERAAFREMVKRRAEGTPVAYLVGHKEFYSIDFLVTPDCLIPRRRPSISLWPPSIGCEIAKNQSRFRRLLLRRLMFAREVDAWLFV